MPSKKKKYNARFPAGRIKKIMQTDEEVGKVALAVPIIISRTLELFVESLLKKAMQVTNAKNAKTLSPSHMKQCILSESRFDFLKDLVEKIPDVSTAEEIFDPVIMTEENVKTESNTKVTNTALEVHSGNRKSHNRLSFGNNGTQSTNNVVDLTMRKHPSTEIPHSSTGPNFYKELPTSPISARTVIQYSPKIQTSKTLSHSVDSIISHSSPKIPKLDTSTNITDMQPVYHLDLSQTGYKSSTSFIKSCQDSGTADQSAPVLHIDLSKYNSETPPPLVPITDVNQVHPLYSIKFGTNNTNEELDEDYDN